MVRHDSEMKSILVLQTVVGGRVPVGAGVTGGAVGAIVEGSAVETTHGAGVGVHGAVHGAMLGGDVGDVDGTRVGGCVDGANDGADVECVGAAVGARVWPRAVR